MKITVVCGNGLGTSLMMEMSIKNILKDLQVSAEVDHVDLGSAKGTASDILLAPKILPNNWLLNKLLEKLLLWKI